jgi:catechol 2,3-dioxygenase-like lactoylglutathione lyase family enzyme
MSIERIHHVAYRCRDAAETVRFCHGLLGMKYTMAISEDRAPRMLRDWTRGKKTVRHAAFLHQREFRQKGSKS